MSHGIAPSKGLSGEILKEIWDRRTVVATTKHKVQW